MPQIINIVDEIHPLKEEIWPAIVDAVAGAAEKGTLRRTASGDIDFQHVREIATAAATADAQYPALQARVQDYIIKEIIGLVHGPSIAYTGIFMEPLMDGRRTASFRGALLGLRTVARAAETATAQITSQEERQNEMAKILLDDKDCKRVIALAHEWIIDEIANHTAHAVRCARPVTCVVDVPLGDDWRPNWQYSVKREPI